MLLEHVEPWRLCGPTSGLLAHAADWRIHDRCARLGVMPSFIITGWVWRGVEAGPWIWVSSFVAPSIIG